VSLEIIPKFTYIKEVEDWEFRSYNKKVNLANEIIKETLSKSKKPAVAFSGGKNSLVVLHLVLKYKPDVTVVFNNTLIEYPETVRYVHKIAEEWNLNFHEVKPEKGVNYWKIVKEYGFPQIRKFRRDGIAEPKCCSLLKTKPVSKFYNENNIDCYLSGISAYESRMRKLVIYKNGLIRLVKKIGHDGYLKQPTIATYPVALWSDKDIWRYIKENNLPVNPVYEKYKLERVGCMYCTGYVGWQKVMARTNPVVLRKILKMMNNQVTLDEYELEENKSLKWR